MPSQVVMNEALVVNPTGVVSGASSQLVAGNSLRNGLSLLADPTGTTVVYLLLGVGVASATNFHVVLTPGGSWDGRVSGVVWGGPVQAFGTGTKIGVMEL